MAIGIDLAIGSSAASGGGGSVNTGVLQISGGGALSGTLQTITDQSSNASPLQLSTASVSFGGSTGLNWDNANTRLGIGTNTPLGILHLKVSAAATRLILDGDAAQSKIITYRTAGLQRFGLYTNNTAESGANVGSDFAIRAYNDAGTLLSTPIFIKRSTGFVGIGTTSVSAMLQVRGDGTNPIARFESSDGSINWRFSAGGFGLENSYQAGIYGAAISGDYSFAASSYNNLGSTVAFQGIANINGTIAVPSSGTGTKHILAVNYIINNAGAQTGTATGIFLNATETALNGMTHNLMDLQVGGVSKFLIKSNAAGFINDVNGLIVGNQIQTGNYYATNTTYGYNVGNQAYVLSNAVGNIILKDAGGAHTSGSFNMLILGAATNAFPALKRNGAAIDFRLADDSGYADVNMGQATFGGSNGYIGINNSASIDSALRAIRTNSGSSPLSISTGEVGVGDTTTYASAIFAIGSTTRGFLPPRMTTTQVNAIASPAEGLVVFNTTISHLCVYQSGGWVKMNHSPM